MKNNKGITLITLVITVIVIGILASVATYSGIEVINSSKLTRFTTEMKLVQTKVNEIYEDRSEYASIGIEEYKEELSTILGLLDSGWGYGTDISSYKYYDSTTLKNNLGIEDIQQSVFINLEKRKVISSEGLTVDGTTYYVLEQLPNSLYNVEYEELSRIQIAKKYGNKFDTNTTISDDYGNKVTIPKDFKIASDSADTVNEGIVIEDEKGNQFVWVPVGDIYTDVERTEENKKQIQLKRYSFADDGTESDFTDTNYTEDTETNHNANYGNAIAKDIESFKKSANSNKGYYIGRYEAGVANADLKKSDMVNQYTAPSDNWTGYVAQEGKKIELVCKGGQQVWDYVTQKKASELSRGMYTEKTYESDLINSYAWDTAIVFIQKCSGDLDYSKQNRLQTTVTRTGEATDGVNKDVRCNIYDMAGNIMERSTETYNDSKLPTVSRGGYYNKIEYYTYSRNSPATTHAHSTHGFRPILYFL